ncbi:ion channel [Bradyrhizobium sp. USDA 4459]
MMLQFLVGTLVSVINIGLHALVTVVAVAIARSAGLRHSNRPRLHLMSVMIAAAVVLKIAHMLEILIWAATYHIVGVAPGDTDMLYFAFVNYTTLGYGDITPVREWQLIGPLTAMLRG